MGIVRRTFDHMDVEIFLQLYKGLIRPHLKYASSVWSPHLMKHKDSLEAVQRRATRQVPGLKDLSYGERLSKLKLPTLTYRRLRGDMIQVFKMLHPTVGYDKTLPHFFEKTITPNLRGHSQKLFVSRSNKDLRKYSFSQRVVKYWNALPESVIMSKDVFDFEKRLDEHWDNQPLKYLDPKADIL